MSGTETGIVGYKGSLRVGEVNGKVGQDFHAAAHREIPREAATRVAIRSGCRQRLSQLPHEHAWNKSALEREAHGVLSRLRLPAAYLGWTMVVLSSEGSRTRICAVPPERRLLLLPSAPELDAVLGPVRHRAERLGVRVEVAEPTPAMIQLLTGGSIDAVIGLASLEVLEKGFDRILASGIPAAAIPLCLEDATCSFEIKWLEELLEFDSAAEPTDSGRYRGLLMQARQLFEPQELETLVPRNRTSWRHQLEDLSPLAQTEAIGHEFLCFGGKYARPFITLAAYDALHDAAATNGDCDPPSAVKKVAISIEAFHKASLIHDDIEDGDQFRYGRPALHEAYGVSTAINVGDYLIGLGYNLVSRESADLGAEAAADILVILSDAHLRLSEGQGAELLWRDARDKQLTPQEALEIYALKTSPAFEAALLSGLRCAGPIQEHLGPLKEFCRLLGMGFQILNDLKDWQGDADNKLEAGLDTLGGRPTLLWALALERLPRDARRELIEIIGSDLPNPERVALVRISYEQANVFSLAKEMVDHFEAQALQITEQLGPPALRELLRYLARLVLERSGCA